MNSLKRKKPTTGSIAANKKGKTAASNVSLSRSQSSTSTNVSTSPLESLDHLIDRPYVEYNPQRDDIVLQVLECEDASKDRMALNGVTAPLIDTKPSPQVRLHGCTDKGVSVVCLLQGLYPYLYFPIGATFDEEKDTPRLIAAIKKNAKTEVSIHSTEIVKREPLMYYRPNKEKYTRFIKIYCGSTSHQNAIARVLEKSDELEGLEDMMEDGKLYDLTVYETGLAYDMRTMVDLDIVGCGWVKIPKSKWKELPKTAGTYKAPYERYGLAIVCQGQDVEGLSPTATSTDPERTKLWSKLAPLRAICLSIISLVETPTKPATTPKSKPKKDDDESLPPTFIASISMVLTSSPLSPSPFDQTVLLTHSDKDIHPLSVSSTIHTVVYSTEKEMLFGFRDFLIKYDPDLLTGYDLCEEISEILDRAKDLNLPKSFPYLARPSSTALKPRSRQTYNASWVRAQRRMAGTSNREYIELGCTGRLVLDMRQVMEKEERLRTYSLNETNEHVLGKKLEFLSATTIAKLLASEELDDKRRVADYAVKRAWAGLEIMRKNASLVSAVEMARVFGLNFQEVFMGQMRRMWGNARGVIVPGNSDSGASTMTESPINWMPVTGYDTQKPVIVLDFKSLYPSIIIAKNLCFSTLLIHKNDLPPESIHEGYGPQECYFASADVKLGVLPQMLVHLLDERVKVKQLMKTTSDAGEKLVLDGRQRAIKVAANAVYGATGAPSSKLQCLPIAETTIVAGAKYLVQAKELVQERYSDVVNVVYGDTDSVFVKTVEDLSVADAIKLGEKISKEVSDEFPDPVFLEFEKVMFPSMLMNRKRYAGLTWTSPTQSQGVIDVKGIEGATRRDSVPIIAKIMAEIMDLLFPLDKNNAGDKIITEEERKRIVDNVQRVVKISVRRILGGEVDVGEFIMTRGLWLGTTSGDYKGKQAHIAVVDKVRKRDPRRVFKDGERVSYVLIQAPPNAKGFEKAEDPEYAITQGLSLDWSYYLEHTVKNPLSRILELLIPAKDLPSLFTATARASVKKTFAGKNNAMSAFLTAGAKTLSKCIIDGKKTAPGKKLCEDHEPLEVLIAAEKQARMERLGGDYNLLDGACRSCQGNIGREVLCTNLYNPNAGGADGRDCAVYFKRMRAAGEFDEAKEDFEGFIEAQALDW